MPAKRGGVITSGEARKLLKDESAMKSTILLLQIECGDRVDDPRLRNPNQTDRARGWRRLPDDEWDEIRRIVRKLLDAREQGHDRRRLAGARPVGRNGPSRRGSCGSRIALRGAATTRTLLWVVVSAVTKRRWSWRWQQARWSSV